MLGRGGRGVEDQTSGDLAQLTKDGHRRAGHGRGHTAHGQRTDEYCCCSTCPHPSTTRAGIPSRAALCGATRRCCRRNGNRCNGRRALRIVADLIDMGHPCREKFAQRLVQVPSVSVSSAELVQQLVVALDVVNRRGRHSGSSASSVVSSMERSRAKARCWATRTAPAVIPSV